jgi:hypothetical protein
VPASSSTTSLTRGRRARAAEGARTGHPALADGREATPSIERIPGMNSAPNVTTAPITAAPTSVARAPRASATGP